MGALSTPIRIKQIIGDVNIPEIKLPFVVFILFYPLILPDDTPSETVTKIVSINQKYIKSISYNWMSTEYRNSIDIETYSRQMEICSKWKDYEFIEVKNGSEKINENNGSVEIIYQHDLIPFKHENKTITIDLIKEDDGWRLKKFYCELTGD